MVKRSLLIAIYTCLIFPQSLFSQPKPIVLDPSYEHDKFGTQPQDIIKKFRAFTSSFDSKDDNDSNGTEDAWGIPEWVAYEIKRFDGDCIPTKNRPAWFTDKELENQGIAPTDDSYKYSTAWRKHHKNWYVRGHLAMKLIAERLGSDAAHNTHTMLNAVPQRAKFNSGIWLDLEYLTGAWAQRFGRVWVITGPVLGDKAPSGTIGENGEFKIAIPEALFKIVIKESDQQNTPDVLAFLYPQIGPRYTQKEPYCHKCFLTSIDEIEELTGLDFFTKLQPSIERKIEKKIVKKLWPIEKSDFIEACRRH